MKLLAILALALSANAWAEEDKFPIDFTCEIGLTVLHLSIAKDIGDSWWEPCSTCIESKIEKKMNFNLNRKQYRNKKNEIKRQEVTETYILFWVGQLFQGSSFLINRYSGRIVLLSEDRISGNCFSGFKEYKDRKF